MASLPSVSGQRVVGAFRKAGWVKDRQHGSHVILIKAGHPASLSVPQHRELAPGTLRALIRASGMSVDQFVDLLGVAAVNSAWSYPRVSWDVSAGFERNLQCQRNQAEIGSANGSRTRCPPVQFSPVGSKWLSFQYSWCSESDRTYATNP